MLLPGSVAIMDKAIRQTFTEGQLPAMPLQASLALLNNATLDTSDKLHHTPEALRVDVKDKLSKTELRRSDSAIAKAGKAF